MAGIDSVRAAFLACLMAVPVCAQQTGSVPAQQTPAATAAPTGCSGFSGAQNAAYAQFIRMIVDELPPGEAARQNPEKFGQDLEAMYRKHASAAEAGDVNEGRKATALELFAMQLKKQPAADTTQKKLCMLARERLRDNGVADALACAVASLDGGRREAPGNKELAKAMVEQAKTMVPEGANASNPGKVLFDEVSKGLTGCY